MTRIRSRILLYARLSVRVRLAILLIALLYFQIFVLYRPSRAAAFINVSGEGEREYRCSTAIAFHLPPFPRSVSRCALYIPRQSVGDKGPPPSPIFKHFREAQAHARDACQISESRAHCSWLQPRMMNFRRYTPSAVHVCVCVLLNAAFGGSLSLCRDDCIFGGAVDGNNARVRRGYVVVVRDWCAPRVKIN